MSYLEGLRKSGGACLSKPSDVVEDGEMSCEEEVVVEEKYDLVLPVLKHKLFHDPIHSLGTSYRCGKDAGQCEVHRQPT